MGRQSSNMATAAAAGLFLNLILASASFVAAHNQFPLLMPKAKPQNEEAYICTPIRLSDTQTFYVTKFTPNATAHTAHHMLVYGCEEPGSEDPTWNCGEMMEPEPGKELHQPCKSGNQIVFAWAMDAPDLVLPADTGFRMGRDTPI